ncbi:unnamed protein product [Vicia faba]|uniref:Uncharacterized protein n=1 Tax=Vicia faba TaxID=3906 RepID=A0AAV0YWR0_VICFA|nr:unnamed protein product [Vicia faba]
MSGSLLGNANSSAFRMGNRAFLPNARIGGQQFHSIGSESTSGQSPLRQRSPSPPSIDHTCLMENFDKQDHPRTRKTSHFSTGMQSQYIEDSSPTLSPNIQVGDLQRLSQVKDLRGPLPSASFQSRYQQQLRSAHTEVNIKNEKPPSDAGSEVSAELEFLNQHNLILSMENKALKTTFRKFSIGAAYQILGAGSTGKRDWKITWHISTTSTNDSTVNITSTEAIDATYSISACTIATANEFSTSTKSFATNHTITSFS